MAENEIVAPAATAPTGAPAETTPQAQTTETPPGDAEKAAETKPEAKAPGFDKLASKLAYQLRESRRQSRELSERNSQILAQLEANRNRPAEDKEPRYEDFASLPEYMKAAAAYYGKQAKPQDSKPETARSDPKFEAARGTFYEDAEDKYADFREVFHDDLPVSPAMGQYLLESENGTDIAYHLGKNEKEARRISRLSPMKQVAELARIEDKLTASPVTKKPSGAPAPVTPVDGTQVAPVNDLSKATSFEEFRRIRNKQLGRGK